MNIALLLRPDKTFVSRRRTTTVGGGATGASTTKPAHVPSLVVRRYAAESPYGAR